MVMYSYTLIFFFRLPRGSFMSNCEKELQELMKQIDLNVVTKKREWEREREGLQSRLQVREKECLMQKSTLEQKHKEVSDFLIVCKHCF